MFKYLIALMLMPVFSLAQKVEVISNNTAKTEVKDGFVINGTLTGFEEGSNITLLNANSGKPELVTQLKDGKFVFKGFQATPDFKLIAVNNQPPYITLFLDNSQVKLSSTKQNFEAATVSGSKSHAEFIGFNTAILPYEGLLNGTEKSSNFSQFEKASEAIVNFIKNNKTAFISPLAIYRLNQLTGDSEQMEELFSGLDQQVKISPIGSYIAQQIADNKKVPIGKPLQNFVQNDVNDKPLSLASLKGKYVLVDFWASWCRPCREENPNVVNMFNLYKDKNFTVLGVSLDKTKEPWLKAIAQDGLNWPQVSDLKGWQNEVAAQFGITSIPQNYLLDPEGNIIAKNLRGIALQYRLHQLLGK